MLDIHTITIISQAGSMIELSDFHRSMQLATACMDALQEMAYLRLHYVNFILEATVY